MYFKQQKPPDNPKKLIERSVYTLILQVKKYFCQMFFKGILTCFQKKM